MSSRFIIFFLILVLCSCKKYNPVNDKIYPIPQKDNLESDIALKALNDATQNSPEVAENYYKKSIYYFNKGLDSLALFNIHEALQRDSTQDDYFLLQAKIYHHNGLNKPALQAIQNIDLTTENNLKILTLAGQMLYKEKKLDESIKLLNKALTIKPDANAYYWKARVALSRSDSTQTVKFLRQALKQKGNKANIYDSFAELYLLYGMNRRAISYADSGLTLYPENPLLNLHKAEAFRKRIYFKDSANYYYLKAYELNDSLHQASYQLAKNAIEQNNYRLAESFLESTLQYNPENPKAHYYLGLAYRRLGKKTLAIQQLEIATEQDPNLYPAKELYWQIKSEMLQAKMLAREDSIRRAYYKKLAEQEEKRKKELEELRKKQLEQLNQ